MREPRRPPQDGAAPGSDLARVRSGDTRMTASRIKSIVLVAGLLVSALTLLSWTQPWFRIGVETEAVAEGAVSVGGEVAAGGLAALGLAGLALIGALSIAGPVFRILLAGLEVLIGVAVVLSATVALVDPVRASAGALTESTGITGDESLAELAGGIATTAWPFIGVILGVSTVVVGVVIAVTSSRWPQSGRKYAATRLVPEPEAEVDTDDSSSSGVPNDPGADRVIARESDSVADWDALSDGSDPTTR